MIRNLFDGSTSLDFCNVSIRQRRRGVVSALVRATPMPILKIWNFCYGDSQPFWRYHLPLFFQCFNETRWGRGQSLVKATPMPIIWTWTKLINLGNFAVLILSLFYRQRGVVRCWSNIGVTPSSPCLRFESKTIKTELGFFGLFLINFVIFWLQHQPSWPYALPTWQFCLVS